MASAMAAAAMPPGMQASVAKGAAALGLPPEVRHCRPPLCRNPAYAAVESK